MPLDPRARQRVQVVPVTPSMRRDVTNEEHLQSWYRASSLSASVKQAYLFLNRDVLRYFMEGGRERPVWEWTKAEVSAYFLHVEANYCGNFRQVPTGKGDARKRAKCRAGEWEGMKDAEQAARENCQTCPLFKKTSTLHQRLHALDAWFLHLASLGVVQVNFMPDVVREVYARRPKPKGGAEKKRNLTAPEIVRLVNETANPMRRGLYACARKWGARPNELFLVDRYASFGLPMPAGVPLPPGFDTGFQKHPQLASFEQGGSLGYLPRKVSEAGEELRDKRTGNRWFVVDAELRPILEQLFAFWEQHVPRKPDGTPAHTRLYMNARGQPLDLETANGWLWEDALRLELAKPEDAHDLRRKPTMHGMRHGEQQDAQLADVPSIWNQHFRGDALPGALGEYFEPKPEQVCQKYHEHMPLLGFRPIAQAPRLRGASEAQAHRLVLEREAGRSRAARAHPMTASVRLETSTGEAWTLPRRCAPSVAYALRIESPGVEVAFTPVGVIPLPLRPLVPLYERALAALS